MKKLNLIMAALIFSMPAYSLKLKEIKSGLGVVWGMDFLENNIIFTERGGDFKILNLETKKVQNIKGAPKVHAKSQGGLLDIKLDPNFKSNKKVYLTYSKKVATGVTTALGVGVLEGSELKNFKDIFVAKGKASGGVHYGSRLSFDGKGHIYITVGDRGNRDNPQKLDNHFGKVMRLNMDGSFAKGNPFIGKANALPEIWSYGHRNPQGLFYDAKTNVLYEMEHGPRGGDEINIIQKGKNYGWPVITYGKEYYGPISIGEGTHKKGMLQPLKQFTPSIAPCGLVLYQGDRYPKLKGSLLSGALALTHLNQFRLSDKKDIRHFDDKGMRVRTVAVSAKDIIYISTDSGSIFELIP